ncbi:MAG: DUF1826 domain-containing protein [Anaerolineales bacterium]|nr:DUF1826 domain-containing protein [Anaerolineales bacterium]
MLDAQVTQPGCRVVESTNPGELAEIYKDTVNIAIWRRPTLGVSQQVLRNGHFPSLSMTLVPEQVSETLSGRLPEFAQRQTLITDIAWLAEMFACLFDLDQLGLRLTVLEKAMCPRFHVDHVPCRLLTSYTGPATEWLPEHRVDRGQLGPGSPELAPPAHDIQHLQSGDVALLKGENWDGNEGHGLVHRSPAVADGESRLLLSLDFA